jgi:hypothetical protein
VSHNGIHDHFYHLPIPIWSVKFCERMVKSYHRDGLGTRMSWPGYVGHLIHPTTRFNGGTTRFGNGDWYPGVICGMPLLPLGFKLVLVPSWGWRLVNEKTT